MSLTMTAAVPLAELVSSGAHLAAQGKGPEAEALYRSWITGNPAHPQLYIAHFNHACQLTALGREAEAIQSLAAALGLNPDFLPARINLGGLMERAGAPDQALRQWQMVGERLVAINGQALGYRLAALRQTARLLTDHRRLAPAEAALRQCLELNPHQRDVMEQLVAVRLAQCVSPALQGVEGVDRATLLRNLNPLSLLYISDDPFMQLGLAADYARHLVKDAEDLHASDRRDAPIALKGRRLRIGYVSSDLRDHAVGTLLVELFELHDKSRIELFAYYCGPKASGAMHERFRAAADHWVDVTPMSDAQAAARIAADGIDILLDVNGYTRDARAGIFARRPAPVQVNWLGYPGTLGTPYHHYIIADDWIIPEGDEKHFSETVLRLPCYQPNDRRRVVGPKPTRAEAGLPVQGFVFCSFNGSQKLTRFTLVRWAEILRRVPGSVLWLLDNGEEMRANVTAFLESQGIAPARLVFAPKLANPDHLARYPLADLFLDSSPYGAHTTASDALWMGVPVLTFSGRSFTTRVCGSLVRAAGLPDMVADSPEAFVERAIALASDPQALAAIRARLVAGRDACTLFDMPRFARALEALFEEMARRHQAGRTPQPDLTNLGAYLTAGCAFDHEAEEMLTRTDYEAAYRARLARQHAREPLPADGRLWSPPAAPRKRAARLR
jgi:predicted O-linked N-acetylglucosamine transferase (SPINDLY family)